MRSASRRSFTVEVKSTGRGRSTIIPTRVAALGSPPPRPTLEPVPASSDVIAEKRRILPNLIVPEPLQVDPEPMSVAEDLPPRRPRGRPRKPRPDPILPVVEAVEVSETAEPALASLPLEREDNPVPAPTPRKLQARPKLDLARGERWKRRLGRWSR